ncbi:RNA ligase family protein [Actinacidiphila sp. bgisy160]|uniref:RNA ligase family protein n=1 Tax=Actinacidiphila sp. bgisy160 TaxID=3413796 RepID=UPI003D743128
MRTHYPRTPHLPWSPGATPDDIRAGDPGALRGREVVVTEKLDGENTTLHRDGTHARSPDSAHHPSRAWVKALQGRIGPLLRPGLRVCGENLHARHSLGYEQLDSWFYGFSVWDGDRCLDWDRTVRFLRGLGIPVPPVLWRGRYDERALRALRLDTARQEGYVVRTVDGFRHEEFGRHVAKWVRTGHVTTGTHWMHAPVVENGLGPAAALWAVRSGAAPDAGALAAAVGLDVAGPGAAERAAEVSGRLDVLRRTGDARLAGVLAALLHDIPRARLAARLAGPLGMPQARRVADLAGLHPALQRPYPDEDRVAGLARMALAADLGVLHAVAAAAAPDAESREQTEWSALLAEEAGLLGPDPFGSLRHGLRAALAGLDTEAADRCWAEARAGYAAGRIAGAEEAVATTWRRRSAQFPRLIHLTGPAGSGKSTFAGTLPGTAVRIALDDLRLARGSRADQRANADVLREGLRRLDSALTGRATVVWDATSLNPHQRSLVHAVARRRDALVTHVVTLVDEEELARRNADRAHPVPAAVLTAQARRFAPPYPGEAHRTWYVGAGGTVEDTDGSLGGAAPGQEA